MENTRFENFINEISATQTTVLQEGAHAIAFGIRQLLRKNIIQEDLLNEDLFYKSYRRFADIDVSPEEIFKWLNEQPTWVASIVKATNAFFKSGYAKRNGYVFYRGVNFMSRVYQEFNKIQKMSDNKDLKKLNNDKWNPGDIWGSTDPIVPNFNNIMELNAWVSKSIEKGYVLPISLKKVGKSARVLLEKYEKNPMPANYRGVKKPKKIFATGINIITSIKPYQMNFRSFNISSKAHIIGEIIEANGSARHGKTAAKDFRKIVKKYHIPQMEQKRISKLSEDQLKQNVINLWGQCGYKFSDMAIESDYKKLKIQNWIGYWSSIINALELGAYLNSNKGKANIIINELYYSAKSLTEFSSDRIKVY